MSGASVGKNADAKLFVLQKFRISECLTREGTCGPACAYRQETFLFLCTPKWTRAEIPASFCCGKDKDTIYGTNGPTQLKHAATTSLNTKSNK